MSSRGFSGTSIAIVVLLLVALFAIGHIPGVNAPPPQPEKPAAAAAAAKPPSPSEMKERMATMIQKKKQMMAMHGGASKGLNMAAPLKPVKDPNSIEANNTFFFQEPDGPQGIAKTQQDIAREKAEYARYQQEMKKRTATKMAVPPTAAP